MYTISAIKLALLVAIVALLILLIRYLLKKELLKVIVIAITILLFFSIYAWSLVNFKWFTHGSQNNQQKVYKVAFVKDYAPWSYTDHGRIAGFDVDLIYEIARRARINIKIETDTIDKLIANLNTGKYDIIAGGIAKQQYTNCNVTFSKPYAMYNVESISLCDSLALPSGLLNPKGKKDTKNNSVINKDLDCSKIALIVSKDEELLKKINTAIHSMQSDGSITALSIKYFGTDISIPVIHSC